MDLELVIETRPAEAVVKLRLLDQRGTQVAGSEFELRKQSPAKWEALFDTQRHVRLFAGALRDRLDAQPRSEQEILDEIGVFLGREVLGADIMAHLAGHQHRTLLIRLPATGNDVLAAALARVPWEIARTAPGQPSLLERNVVVRAITGDVAATTETGDGADPLRVLLVFAEAPGSRPLAMREERENLLRLFFDEILPRRRVEVDVLCHGVTRERLREQITAYGGYHIIHWSGHGRHNLLELHGQNGGDNLSGADLVKLIHEAGGFIPQFLFLSACLSGTFVSVKNWADFQAAMAGAAPEPKEGAEPKLPELLNAAAGAYTGTAVELLRAGVPEIVAMRYEVGDAYARDLAERFYQHLLADEAGHTVGKALSLARGEIAREANASSGYSAADHATPLILGQGQLAFHPAEEMSDQADQRRPLPQPLLSGGSHELDLREVFVGRGAELTRMAAEWLPRDQKAIALVQGLAGLGKTAVASEAVHLWHRRFTLVLAFQAKPVALLLEDFYRLTHAKLVQWSPRYLKRTQRTPNLAVHLPPGGQLTGAARFEQMRVNLVEALRNESILIVVDNFENNLESVAGAQGYRCDDPEWDLLFQTLGEQLPPTGSRVLVTSRHRLQVLADPERAVWLPLGPLPFNEAVLYLQSHDSLRGLYYRDLTGRAIVTRLLRVGRGHPLILERLASLSTDDKALAGALDRLEAKGGWQDLPDIFAGPTTAADRQRERDYLQDVAVSAVDLLIERLSAGARSLLHIVTLANEPVPPEVIETVWWNLSRTAPAETQEDAAESEPAAKPLLDELHAAGLLGREANVPNAPYSFHELVRERIAAWTGGEDETRRFSGEEIWRLYGESYLRMLVDARSSGLSSAMTVAAEAGRRALTYFVRARAFERLIAMLGIIAETPDRSVLRTAIEELWSILEHVPAGPARRTIRGTYAMALTLKGDTLESLPHHETAVAEAEGAGDLQDVSWMAHNWGNALRQVGRLHEAKEAFRRSLVAKTSSGGGRAESIGTEVQIFKIELRLGRTAEVLPDIDARVAELREIWTRACSQPNPGAQPGFVTTGRAFITALDVADDANRILERWGVSLELLTEIEETKRRLGQTELQLAAVRANRLMPLLRFGRVDEAQEIAESCLLIFREGEAVDHEATTLSNLAAVWEMRRDVEQAVSLARQALAIRNSMQDPEQRASSHGTLSNYLDSYGDALGMTQHSLAALAYRTATGHVASAQLTLKNIGIDIANAAAKGARYELPRLRELLALPEFAVLADFLANRSIDVDRLQAEIDRSVEEQRAQVLAAAGQAGPGTLPPE